jgi:hypothetical protein
MFRFLRGARVALALLLLAVTTRAYDAVRPMRYADRTMLVFEDPKLDGFDFQSIGYAMTLAGMRADVASNVGTPR